MTVVRTCWVVRRRIAVRSSRSICRNRAIASSITGSRSFSLTLVITTSVTKLKKVRLLRYAWVFEHPAAREDGPVESMQQNALYPAILRRCPSVLKEWGQPCQSLASGQACRRLVKQHFFDIQCIKVLSDRLNLAFLDLEL